MIDNFEFIGKREQSIFLDALNAHVPGVISITQRVYGLGMMLKLQNLCIVHTKVFQL